MGLSRLNSASLGPRNEVREWLIGEVESVVLKPRDDPPRNEVREWLIGDGHLNK